MNKRNTLVGPQLQRHATGLQPDWKRALSFLAAIVLGAAVATQVLANSYHYYPSLGLNLFHFYPPWFPKRGDRSRRVISPKDLGN
jgi:hypothetical protein